MDLRLLYEDESEVKDYECVSFHKDSKIFQRQTSEIDIEVIWILRNRASVSDCSSNISPACLSDFQKSYHTGV